MFAKHSSALTLTVLYFKYLFAYTGTFKVAGFNTIFRERIKVWDIWVLHRIYTNFQNFVFTIKSINFDSLSEKLKLLLYAEKSLTLAKKWSPKILPNMA